MQAFVVDPVKKTIFADMQLIMRISAQVRYSFKFMRLVGSVIDLFLVSFSHNSCCGHELLNHYIWSNIWISQILAQVGETRSSLFAIIDDNIAKFFLYALVSLERLELCPKLKTAILRGNRIEAAPDLRYCPQLWKVDLANNTVNLINVYALRVV